MPHIVKINLNNYLQNILPRQNKNIYKTKTQLASSHKGKRYKLISFDIGQELKTLDNENVNVHDGTDRTLDPIQKVQTTRRRQCCVCCVRSDSSCFVWARLQLNATCSKAGAIGMSVCQICLHEFEPDFESGCSLPGNWNHRWGKAKHQ